MLEGVAMQIMVSVHAEENIPPENRSLTPTHMHTLCKRKVSVTKERPVRTGNMSECDVHFPPLVSVHPSLVHLVDLAPLTG